MSTPTPLETDWSEAPDLLEGAMQLALTPEGCDVDYWIANAAQGTWRGLVNGHAPGDVIPPLMFEEGPLRAAVLGEFAFRAIAEEIATRAISFLVAYAPDIPTMEFYSTQILDEARHARAFRAHLVELGIPEGQLAERMEELAGSQRDRVLRPLEEFALPVMRDRRDFVGGVIILTVLVEGVLAPTGALSERKWRVFDPAAAGIARGANIDEIRHLTVGGTIVRRHLAAHPEETARINSLIADGRRLWAELPAIDVVYERELLFQQGIEQHGRLLGDYELVPGRRLADTTPEERLTLAQTWSHEVQTARLSYMGLDADL
ncbi:MAG TPA: hypothetical protein VGX48_10490 [Pyrinomonadaceae bacterium]|jgi:hypothetical protein|nr:hypothetical protein [Pyrinomonadaceae bacterium]